MNLTEDEHWKRITPAQSLIFLFLLVFFGFTFVGPGIGLFVALPFYEGSLMEMLTAIQNPLGDNSIKIPLFIIQGCATLFGFVVLPYLYGKSVLKLKPEDVFGKMAPGPEMSLLVVILVIVFMGANSIFIEWNANLDLPSWMSGFENWARSFENQAEVMTKFLTSFDNNSQFFIALVVIAVLPAVGEELVFRGLIQNHIRILAGNIHLSIWLAAIIFSFFHMQFFGFVPRVILGALFGYLYAWSGNLAYPILAHFMNNGFTLLMIYLHSKGAVNFDIESSDTVSITSVLISAALTVILLYIFKRYFEKKMITVQHE